MFGETTERKKIVEKYLTWKGASDAGMFIYYDKEAGEEKEFNLTEFILLRKSFTIKGWSDAQEKAIYSNQIDKFTEELYVKS